MKPPTKFTALRDIKPDPTGYAFSHRTGDDVSVEVVENLKLRVGVDVMPAGPDVIPRPDDDADRRAWEAYVIGQGTPVEEAQNMERDDLVAAYPAEPPRTDFQELPPAKNASRDDWVRYATKTHGVTAESLEGVGRDDLVAQYHPENAPANMSNPSSPATPAEGPAS